MRAFFSVAAYKNYHKVAAICSEAEAIANQHLSEKTYSDIKFLTAQFSFLKLVGSQEPTLDDNHTLSLVIPVFADKDEPEDLVQALIKNLDSPRVPLELRMDLEQAFRSRGWLSKP